MAYTTQQKINIGRVCTFLASNEIAGGGLSGGMIDRRLPNLLYATTYGLEWLNELDSANEDIEPIGNHLFSICKHQFKAIVSLSIGGGVAVPTSPDSRYVYNVINATITIAGATYTNTDLILGTDLEFILWNKVPLVVSEDFSYNNATGVITLLNGNTFGIGDIVTIPYNQLV